MAIDIASLRKELPILGRATRAEGAWNADSSKFRMASAQALI